MVKNRNYFVQNEVTLIDKPKVFITEEAFMWMRLLVKTHKVEVSWYGTVERDGNNFLIDNICYPKHTDMSHATCAMGADALLEVMRVLKKRYPDRDQYKKKMSEIRLHGHSHHSMGVTPSSTDEKTFKERMVDNNTFENSFAIRIIDNNAGDMKIDLFDSERGIRVENLEYEVVYKDRGAQRKELVDKVIGEYLDPENVDVDHNNIGEFLSAIEESLVKEDTDRITKKITELDKVNIPTVTSYNYRHTTGNSVTNFGKGTTVTKGKGDTVANGSTFKQKNAGAAAAVAQDKSAGGIKTEVKAGIEEYHIINQLAVAWRCTYSEARDVYEVLGGINVDNELEVAMAEEYVGKTDLIDKECEFMSQEELIGTINDPGTFPEIEDEFNTEGISAEFQYKI